MIKVKVWSVCNAQLKSFSGKLVLNTYLSKNNISITENVVTFNTNTPIFVHDNGGYNDDTIKIMEFFKWKLLE